MLRLCSGRRGGAVPACIVAGNHACDHHTGAINGSAAGADWPHSATPLLYPICSWWLQRTALVKYHDRELRLIDDTGYWELRAIHCQRPAATSEAATRVEELA